MKRTGLLILVSLAATLIALGFLWSLESDWTSETPLVGVVVGSVTGVLVLLKRPGNTVGRLLLGLGLAGCVQFASENYWGAFGSGVSVPSAAAVWAVKLGGAAATFAFGGMLVFLPVLFPTGRPHTRWTRVVLMFAMIVIGLQVGGILLSGQDICAVETQDECLSWLIDPPGIQWLPSPVESPAETIFGPAITLLIVGGLSAAVSRYRSSRGELRLQMKWFALAAFTSVLIIPPAILLSEFAGFSVLGWVFNLPFTLIPVAVGIAVLRYRLFEIDRLVSRTISYAIVVGVLAGAVAILATVVSTQFDGPLIVAATTLGVSAAFNPLRRRVQAWVDRRFNRAKYDAERVMNDFAQSLRDETGETTILEGWQEVVFETMQPSSVGVWVR